MSSQLVIIHLDLDSFYAQVGTLLFNSQLVGPCEEHLRLGIPLNEPLAVQQWQSLIAVNYAAKAQGVKRYFNSSSVLSQGEIHLIHVETLKLSSKFNQDEDIKSTQKVCLDRYRQASKEIFKILARFSSALVKLEKGGLDEAFLDVTELVNEQVSNKQEVKMLKWSTKDWGILISAAATTTAVNDSDDKEEVVELENSWQNRRWCKAAEICKEIRQNIYERLCLPRESIGIAGNKMLAKLCSARFKPNLQAVLRETEVEQFIKNTPFQKIRWLGGKFGHEVESFYQVEKAGDLWNYSLMDLQKSFGVESGQFLYNAVRGIDQSVVSTTRVYLKSMSSAKAFRPFLQTSKQLEQWAELFSLELMSRLQDEWEETKRWPKTLSVIIVTQPGQQLKSLTFRKSGTVSFSFKELSSVGSIILVKAVTVLTENLDKSHDIFPCRWMAVALSQFETMAEAGVVELTKFFKKSTTSSVPTSSSIPKDNNSSRSKSKKSRKIEDYFLVNKKSKNT